MCGRPRRECASLQQRGPCSVLAVVPCGLRVPEVGVDIKRASEQDRSGQTSGSSLRWRLASSPSPDSLDQFHDLGSLFSSLELSVVRLDHRPNNVWQLPAKVCVVNCANTALVITLPLPRRSILGTVSSVTRLHGSLGPGLRGTVVVL